MLAFTTHDHTCCGSLCSCSLDMVGVVGSSGAQASCFCLWLGVNSWTIFSFLPYYDTQSVYSLPSNLDPYLFPGRDPALGGNGNLVCDRGDWQAWFKCWGWKCLLFIWHENSLCRSGCHRRDRSLTEGRLPVPFLPVDAFDEPSFARPFLQDNASVNCEGLMFSRRSPGSGWLPLQLCRWLPLC